MTIEWNDERQSRRPGHHLHQPRVETRRRQMRGGRFNPSGHRPLPDQGGSEYSGPETTAENSPESIQGAARTLAPTAQRSIAMQANSQDGSSGQSSSQHGIAAIAISFVRVEAGCDMAETSTATVRRKGRKRRKTALILSSCWICAFRSSRVIVSCTSRNHAGVMISQNQVRVKISATAGASKVLMRSKSAPSFIRAKKFSVGPPKAFDRLSYLPTRHGYRTRCPVKSM